MYMSTRLLAIYLIKHGFFWHTIIIIIMITLYAIFQNTTGGIIKIQTLIDKDANTVGWVYYTETGIKSVKNTGISEACVSGIISELKRLPK